jgi:hypothetical protein
MRFHTTSADSRPIAELKTRDSERQLFANTLYQLPRFSLFLHTQHYGLHTLAKPDVSDTTGTEIDLVLLTEVIRYLKLPRIRVVQGELYNRIGNIIVCLIPMKIIVVNLPLERFYPSFLDQTTVAVGRVARDATDARRLADVAQLLCQFILDVQLNHRWFGTAQ